MSREIEGNEIVVCGEDLKKSMASGPRVRVYEISCEGVGSKDSLLSAIAKFMAFPDYARSNWDSLEECLRDLPGANAFLLIFEGADRLVYLSEEDRSLFLSILRDTCEFWRGEGVIFSVIMKGDRDLRHLTSASV
jgi:hypothetical protein